MLDLWTLHPIVTIVIGLIALAWLVLFLLMPFMIEGIRAWTIKSHRELAAINAKLERLNALLAERSAPRQPGSGASTTAPARREPTISDFEVDAGDERRRR